jgi:hypothetical protein
MKKAQLPEHQGKMSSDFFLYFAAHYASIAT